MAPDHDTPPLVPERSLSNERALDQATDAGGADAIAMLAQLSEAEENARKAYATVAEMVTFEAAANLARDAAAEHETRRLALGALVESLGGLAPRRDQCREILSHGTEELARATTETEGLAALELLRDELAITYSQALESTVLDEAQRAAVAGFAAPLARG